ncbi:MAG: hypothetical protein WCR20_13975, partial [Verrucomicrobiota bacterium]
MKSAPHSARGIGHPNASGLGFWKEMLRLKALALRRFLRSPLVIVGEIVAIAFATGLGASLPQAGSATVESLARLREGGEVQSMLV